MFGFGDLTVVPASPSIRREITRIEYAIRGMDDAVIEKRSGL